MITSSIIAFALVPVGVILLRDAPGALSTGAAETEENGTIFKKRNPIRFSLFLVLQFAFGCIFVAAGALLVAASFSIR